MGVFALMPALDQPIAKEAGGWFSLHAALTLLSFGAFGLSAVASVMFLSQAHDLKFHKLRAVLSSLPPIERLEKVINRSLQGGLILLTGGMLVGGYYLKQTQGVFYSTDPAILWSGLVWLVYLGLVLMRSYFARGGRRFAWGAIGSFAFVMLTFWGFYLLSGIHQP
jgi:HemX protein